MEQVLLVVQVLIAVALIGMVLLQRSESDGFGLSGGSGNNLLTGRGVANLMTRTTAILAALFMINSLALSVMAARGRAPSIIEQIEKDNAGNAVPVVPVVGADKAAKKDAKPEVKPEVKEEAPKVPVAEGVEVAPEQVKKPAAKKAAPKIEEAPAEEADHNE